MPEDHDAISLSLTRRDLLVILDDLEAVARWRSRMDTTITVVEDPETAGRRRARTEDRIRLIETLAGLARPGPVPQVT